MKVVRIYSKRKAAAIEAEGGIRYIGAILQRRKGRKPKVLRNIMHPDYC